MRLELIKHVSIIIVAENNNPFEGRNVRVYPLIINSLRRSKR